MSVEIHCMCGKLLKASDKHAGTPARCPECGRIWQLPESPGACVSYGEAPGRIIQAQVNDRLVCASPSCHRDFRVNQSSTIDERAMLCPMCGAKLELHRSEPAPSPAVEHDLTDLLDEVMPTSGSEQDVKNRKRIHELLAMADSCEPLSPERANCGI